VGLTDDEDEAARRVMEPYVKQARRLLAELDGIKGPGRKMKDWNIAAETLTVFAAAALHCASDGRERK